MPKKTQTIRCRLTTFELSAFDDTIQTRNEKNQSNGISSKPINRNQVLQSLIRNFSGLGEGFLSDETFELREANRRLLGIGRNLNQVVKKIHTGELEISALTESLLQEILSSVEDSRASIEKLILENKKRGRID